MAKGDSDRPEEMAAFFDYRAAGYDAHMRESLGPRFDAFYAAVASPVETTPREVAILDLGCGTGAELAWILDRAPDARITCIDLSERMLDRLRERYAAHLGQLRVIHGSYLELDFPEGAYDYAVSVMTMHHFPYETKKRLYSRIRRGLRPGGLYIEGDYYVEPAAEQAAQQRYEAAMQRAGAGLYHLDLPFSVETQRRLLAEAGFAAVAVVWAAGEAAVLTART